MLTSAQFTEWAAFLALEPDVGTRLDWVVAAHAKATSPGGKNIDGPLIRWGEG